MAGLLLLAGCSSVPDAVNPVEWYRSAASLFEDDEAPASDRTASSQAARGQTGDQAYPNLGTVPARPTDISSPSERRALQQGLVADRDQARYTDQQPANAIGGGTPPVPTPDTARTAPVAAPTPSPAPPAPATPAPAVPAATAPSVSPSPAAQPPAARIAPRVETPEPQSAGAAMLERRRQEVLAERAAAATAADESRLPQAPAATPQPSAPQASAPQASAPAARAEPRPESTTESRPRTASEIYREEFARSAAPVATRSAEPAPAPTAPQAAAAPDRAAPAAADRSGISYLAATILFDHGSTALDPAERETLRRIAAEHRKAGGGLRIVGHASSRTTDMRPLQHQLANFQVSVSRAETVAQELARLGVPVRAMEVIGVGDSQPIYYEVMPAGEAGNRRVEIFVDY